MTPDDVIEQLKKIGIEISRPTLTRYEKQGLIPEPQRGALGRGGGRWTDYPKETIAEAYAAWSLMHGEYGDNFIQYLFGGKVPSINPKAINIIRLHVRQKDKLTYQAMGWITEQIENGKISDDDKDAFMVGLMTDVLEKFDDNCKEHMGGATNYHVISAFTTIWSDLVKCAQEKMSE